jgi:hypothetical protein
MKKKENTGLTYVQAASMIKRNPYGVDSKGGNAPNLIRRDDWTENKVLTIDNKGQLRMADVRLNPSTKKHMVPEFNSQVTAREDLWATDWCFIDAADYF